MEKLIGYCPLLTDTSGRGSEGVPCMLNGRALAAVVALGLFAVKTEAKVSVFSSYCTYLNLA